MTDWKETTLSDIGRVVTGKTPSTSDVSFYGGRYPFITPTDIKDDHNYCLTDRYLSEDGKDLQKSILLPKDAVCYTCIASIGKMCLTKTESFTNQQINSIVIDESKAHYKFVFYLLKYLTPQIKKMAGGTITGIINKSQFENFTFEIPDSIEEQKEIANVLSSLDDKIELLREENKTLESTAQAIFKEWFVNFNFPNAEGQPYKSSGGKMIDSELGEIPEGWRIGKIYEFLRVDYGYPFKSELFNEHKKGLPLIRIRNLKDGNLGIYTTEECSDHYIVEAGDILAGMDAEFRPCIWKGEKGLLNQRVCRFYPLEGVGHVFSLEAMKEHLNFYEKTKFGTTVSHLGKSDLDSIDNIIPSQTILEDFYSISEPAYRKVVLNNSEIQTLSTLRDTLLPKLMSGETRL